MISFEQAMSESLAQANRASEEAGLALHEFLLAAGQGDFERAEAARIRVLAHTEANLDALMVAHRRMADAQRP